MTSKWTKKIKRFILEIYFECIYGIEESHRNHWTQFNCVRTSKKNLEIYL